MDNLGVLERFTNINTWKRGGKRAPHKPLLLLWALGRIQQGDEGPWTYEQVASGITPLLREFAPSVKSIRPEYPFVKLCNDGIWRLSNTQLDTKKEISPRQLMDRNVRASFSKELLDTFRNSPELSAQIVSVLLAKHFPATYMDDLVQASDLKLYTVTRVQRDAKFRTNVLEAYDWKCALCGYQVFHNKHPVGLEAAHIKWHMAGGSDQVCNGIALCSIHHKLFDRGCFRLDHSFDVKVAPHISGLSAQEHLMRFDGRSISQLPKETISYPGITSLDWHLNEVFKKYGV